MAEQINLTTADQVVAGTNDYHVAALLLDWDGARIDVRLIAANGLSRTISYSGDTATTLMKALNTANLSIKSLHKRIFERLVAGGYLAGAVSGVPD